MEARTKIQVAVKVLAKSLPALTTAQKDYAYSKFFKQLCYATKSNAFCLECGRHINMDTIRRKRVTCEVCGKALKVEYTRKSTQDFGPYYFAVTSLKRNGIYDFQLVRTFEFRCFYKKGQAPNLFIREVCQNWYNIDGKEVIYARLMNNYTGTFQGSMAIRKPTMYTKYEITPEIYCKTSQFRKEYVKKGISYKMMNISLKDIIEEIKCPYVETLLKEGYYHILYNWSIDTVIKYWGALKICIRNKYKINTPSLYRDLLDALAFLNKDLRNSFFVCPKNIKKAHDYYIHKKAEVQVGKNIAANMKKAEEKNAKYIAEKRKFFNLELRKNGITIQPLRSVQEFIAEGTYLNHCVFRSSYYEKKDSLILSARIKNRPVETIEVSLKNFNILQCHGKGNEASKQHKEIVSLLKNNMFKIKQLSLSS